MMNGNDIVLNPFQSVDIFGLDSQIENYQSYLNYWHYEPDDEFGKSYYKSLDGNLMIAVRNQKIESIFCYQSLYYKGVNLIGLTLNDFKALMNTEPVGEVDELDFEMDGYPQFVYEFERVGLQVWEKQDLIVTIVASGQDSYLDESSF